MQEGAEPTSFLFLALLPLSQHEITELDDEHDGASDITEGQDEKGETTDIKDELEYFVNGNESVDHNQNLFNCKQQDEKKRF